MNTFKLYRRRYHFKSIFEILFKKGFSLGQILEVDTLIVCKIGNPMYIHIIKLLEIVPSSMSTLLHYLILADCYHFFIKFHLYIYL